MKLRELLDVSIFIKEIEIEDENKKYYTEIDIKNNKVPKEIFEKKVVELQVDYGYLGIKVESEKEHKQMKNIQDRIHKIYNYYGAEIETQKFVEEMDELMVAVVNQDRKNISQEMADVFITCMHMLIKFDIALDEVEKQIEYKLSRQEERMVKEQLNSLKLNNKDKLNKYLSDLINREG